MKAEGTTEGQHTRDTAGIIGDAHGRLRRYCWVRKSDVRRLDELSRKLRSLNGETTDHRPELTKGLTPEVANPNARAARTA